jgi:glycogen phosphorylase
LSSPHIAYFSMEVGFAADVPTYSGGLGVLAGDTLKAAADLELPIVGVTLLHRTGYFFQRLDEHGKQQEQPASWSPRDFLTPLDARVTVRIEGRDVRIAAWRADLVGATGAVVPVILLDSDLPENTYHDQRWTDSLYGGDERYRLIQEAILGIGGVRMLRALFGPTTIDRFHMNEGHAALLTAELLDEQARATNTTFGDDRAAHEVRQRCAFTTHTPVPAGHDRFTAELVRHVLGAESPVVESPLFMIDGALDMTHAALNLSRYANGVAKKHGAVSRAMHPGRAIDSITNGVHAGTWVGPAMVEVFDTFAPGWRADACKLEAVKGASDQSLRAAHDRAKSALIARVNRVTNAGLSTRVFTIGCARRATPYKRLDLILSDPERLRRLAHEVGPIQIVFAGKAHPRDWGGKANIERIVDLAGQSRDGVRVVYMPNYDMELCGLMTSGCDIWLNTPLRPLEASGTSGMKAAMNGVPSLSILDGWWIEGCEDGVTGWAVSEEAIPAGVDLWATDAESLYQRLERDVVPTYYREPAKWAAIMRNAIAHNGAMFNTHRMVREYAAKAYGLGAV